MISRRVLLRAAVAFGVGVAAPAQRADLSGQADQDDRAVPAGRADRHHGAAGRQVHHRQRSASRWWSRTGRAPAPPSAPRRPRRRRPDGYTLMFGSSGSLAVAPSLYVNAGIDPLKMFAPVVELRAAAACHGGVGAGAGQDRGRVHRLRQGQSRQAELRRGPRHAAAPAQHAVQDQGRHRRHLRSLPGRGPVGDRPGGRAQPTTPSTAR